MRTHRESREAPEAGAKKNVRGQVAVAALESRGVAVGDLGVLVVGCLRPQRLGWDADGCKSFVGTR